jgi:Ca2+/Na+ antiporter
MNPILLHHNIKKIGITLIAISITYFLVNLFYPIEIPFLNGVKIYSLLSSSFPQIEGVSKGENFNPRFFTIILLIGLLFITICKQHNEDESINKIRLDSFILVTKLFVFFNILSLFLAWGFFWEIYILFINSLFYLIIYNIIFYYKISKKIN